MKRWALLLMFSAAAFAVKQPPVATTVNAPVDAVRVAAVAKAT